MKILIVDDDVDVIRSLGNAFTTLLKGYQVFTAMTANQGLNIIKREQPEAIVMDVRLGPVSGMDLLADYGKYIKDYRPRVIVITAYDDEKAEKQAEELKVDAYLRKPFNQDELYDAVTNSLAEYHESQARSLRLLQKGFQKKKKAVDTADQEFKEKLNGDNPSGQ